MVIAMATITFSLVYTQLLNKRRILKTKHKTHYGTVVQSQWRGASSGLSVSSEVVTLKEARPVPVSVCTSLENLRLNCTILFVSCFMIAVLSHKMSSGTFKFIFLHTWDCWSQIKICSIFRGGSHSPRQQSVKWSIGENFYTKIFSHVCHMTRIAIKHII